jgi:outer membrane protein OmpA-like peptidoglycan-associated protein
MIIRLVGLQFHSGKATLQPSSFSILGKVLSSIQEFPNYTISIEGHTDSYGSDAKNQELSEMRADAVLQYLMAANSKLHPDKIKAVGFGETLPCASNETKEGRAQNRRIEVVIRGAKTAPVSVTPAGE